MVSTMVRDDDEYEDENEDDDHEPTARRKRGSTTKKVFIVILILIIIIAVFGIFWMRGSVKEVIINSPVELDDGSGIAITVQTPLEGGGSASGESRTDAKACLGA